MLTPNYRGLNKALTKGTFLKTILTPATVAVFTDSKFYGVFCRTQDLFKFPMRIYDLFGLEVLAWAK